MTNLKTLVLYTCSNKNNMKCLYDEHTHTLVNTRYSDLQGCTQGYRFKDVVVFDEGVSEQDITYAKGRLYDTTE